MRVAVIGAGPSGLVTLKYLKTAHHFFPIKPIETALFEAEPSIGGTFAHRTYEDAEASPVRLRGAGDVLTTNPWHAACLVQAAHYLL